MSSATQRRFSVAEYLAREERSEIKHEFYRGEIFAMSGGSRAHATINGNIYFQLRNRLAGKGCAPSPADQRIQIPKIGLHTYPDVSIVCGKPEFDLIDREANTNPIVIIEVLSPSTERYDRTIKFGFYRNLPSLKQYVLVAQDEARVETFVRNENDAWIFADAVGIETSVQFPPLQCELLLAEIYEGVELDPAGPRLNPPTND